MWIWADDCGWSDCGRSASINYGQSSICKFLLRLRLVRWMTGPYISSAYCFTIRRALNRGVDREHRLPHDIEPAARDALGVAIVEGRNDLVFEQVIERFGVGRVDRPRSRSSPAGCRSASRSAGVALGPPAVADADLRHAVDRGLHAARAARLERLARIVQPDVAALDQEVRHVQVVVVDERDPPGEHRIGRAPVDLLQVMFARFVGGMRLAGEDDLNGPARGVEDRRAAARDCGRSARAACSR